MRNNIFYPFIAQWIRLTRGRASQPKWFLDSQFWSQAFREWHESGRSFKSVGMLAAGGVELFEEWISHPRLGQYWDDYNPTTDEYARMRIPILTITGCYDDDQPGALEHYRQHLRFSSGEVRGRHYLVIGPWDHAGTRSPAAEFGGIRVGAASLLNVDQLHVDWFAWTLSDSSRPDFLKDRVSYYVMGADQWRYAGSLDEITSHHQSLFLDSSSNANDVFCSGTLGPVRGAGTPDFYRYDPRRCQGDEVIAESNTHGGALTDQTVIFALRGKALFYHSAPFPEDTEVSGFFRLSAWIAIDCPDTDIYVSVYEIALDGSTIRLSTDAIRARYRDSLRESKLIETPDPIRYEFERFTFISRRIRAGHRLRLVIAPIGRLVETVFAEKNYNTGGVVAEETAADARPVTVRLHHDMNHPSVLHVPMGRTVSDEEGMCQ